MATASKLTVAKATDGSATSLNDATSDVTNQLATLKADLAGLADAVRTLSGAGAAVAKDEAQAQVARAAEAGHAAQKKVTEATTQGAEMIADYARNKPMTALAVAAGAGLLIGLLTAPRK